MYFKQFPFWRWVPTNSTNFILPTFFSLGIGRLAIIILVLNIRLSQWIIYSLVRFQFSLTSLLPSYDGGRPDSKVCLLVNVYWIIPIFIIFQKKDTFIQLFFIHFKLCYQFHKFHIVVRYLVDFVCRYIILSYCRLYSNI